MSAPQRLHVLVDIDHTLSDAFHRDGMIGVETWDAYHAASIDDEPLHDVCGLVRALALQGYAPVGLTSRPAKWRQLTNQWLIRHGVPLDTILMREGEDYRPSAEMKTALALEYFGGEEALRERVAFILEDRDDVASAFHGLGVTVLQVYGRRA